MSSVQCRITIILQLVFSLSELLVLILASGYGHICNIYNIYNTVSFSKDVFSQGAEYQLFLGVFLMFLAFFHSKIWAKFHFGTFKPYV